jgi:hypothetical protein
MTENKRMEEWLRRVAVDIGTLRNTSDLTNITKLEKIKDSYQILSVMIKVAQGRAYMAGVQPPKGI